MRRFDRKILVELPNKDERRKLLKLMLSKVKVNTVSDEMAESIASRSIGVSPSVLTNILETAKREAFKQNTVLDDAILNEAYESMTLGEKKQWSREYLERTARHEAGHTLIYYIGGHTPEYLTVESRGNIGGYMHRSEEELESPLRKKRIFLTKFAALSEDAPLKLCTTAKKREFPLERQVT